MKVFMSGAISEFTETKYKHFALQRYHFYTAMEKRFDNSSSSGALNKLWKPLSLELRQADCLRDDLKEVNLTEPERFPPTPATKAYIKCIEQASENGLIGHFYCRYFADLFGGSMLGHPTSISLGVPSPKFYSFPSSVTNDRAAYIERVYQKINECGETMDESNRTAVVRQAETAFEYNVGIIKEQGIRLVPYIGLGLLNVSKGYLLSRFQKKD